MPCPTGSFKIISRGKGQSCMASCAYYAGEKKDYHDKGDGNPHVHIMLTLRAMDENGKWMPKSKNVYALDENGNRIRTPNGSWKRVKVDKKKPFFLSS